MVSSSGWNLEAAARINSSLPTLKRHIYPVNGMVSDQLTQGISFRFMYFELS